MREVENTPTIEPRGLHVSEQFKELTPLGSVELVELFIFCSDVVRVAYHNVYDVGWKGKV
jgi:hypothetical protein